MVQAVQRNKRVSITVAVVVAIPVVALAWYLFSPLFVTKEVQEEFPFAANAVVPKDMTRAEIEKTMATLAKTEGDQVTEDMPDEIDKADAPAALLKTGTFEGADRFHKGSGVAKIFRGPDGAHLLRVENFSVTNGPDLRVILSPVASPSGSSEVTASGYVELGKLKGNVGNQNYPIPAEADIGALRSVVIYCKPFRVVFSVATLEDEG